MRAEMQAEMRAKRHVEIHAKMHAGMHVKMHAEITCPSETIRGLLFVWFACSLRSAMGFTARDSEKGCALIQLPARLKLRG